MAVGVDAVGNDGARVGEVVEVDAVGNVAIGDDGVSVEEAVDVSRSLPGMSSCRSRLLKRCPSSYVCCL